jgi:diaminopimelate epimerase
MDRLPFVKLHGLGNDFLAVDGNRWPLDFAGALGRQLCDRHTGVGGDGVLVWHGPAEAPTMTVINADGSLAAMCGNGLRCFVKYLLDRHVASDQLTVATGNGPLACVARRGADGRVAQVRIGMGAPRWQFVDEALEGVRLTALSLGNPHAVTFATLTPEARLDLGPRLCQHVRFPDHANIGFARIVAPNHIELAVFERGCGWTQACGTGATAAVLAASRLGLVDPGDEVKVRLPGGELAIEVHADGSASMTGPAVEVFSGEVMLPVLA